MRANLVLGRTDAAERLTSKDLVDFVEVVISLCETNCLENLNVCWVMTFPFDEPRE